MEENEGKYDEDHKGMYPNMEVSADANEKKCQLSHTNQSQKNNANNSKLSCIEEKQL